MITWETAKNLGVEITYRIQEDAGGIAQALGLAEQFIQPDKKFIVLLGDNLFEDSLTGFVQQFQEQKQGAKVVLKKVVDPRRYGVPIMQRESIIFIDEKPAMPKSQYCVTGIYMYCSDVFQVIKQLQPSARGELEITDVNNFYAKEETLSYGVLQGWWIDAGTHESLRQASNHYL